MRWNRAWRGARAPRHDHRGPCDFLSALLEVTVLQTFASLSLPAAGPPARWQVASATVAAALDAGINFFDTAQAYQVRTTHPPTVLRSRRMDGAHDNNMAK